MQLPEEIRSSLAYEDFEKVEAQWLGLMEEDSSNIELLVEVAKQLAEAGDSGRADLLLGLLDDELKGSDSEARLQFLRAGGRRLFSARDLHAEILVTLERLYADREQLDTLLQAVRLRSPGRTPAETWERVDKLEKLLLLEPGVIVWMEGKGAGRVTEVNLGLQSLKVDFERLKGLSVGFKVATKVLHELSTEHVLRRKLEEPEALRELAKEDGAALLRAVLESFGRPMAAGEIREALAGVVAERSWASWWSSARQHPQVLVKAGARPAYSWAATGDAAMKSVESSFESADLPARLKIYRRHASRDATFRGEMAAILSTTAEAEYQKDPAVAMRIWQALDKSGDVPDDAAWSLPRLVDDLSDFGPMFGNLDNRADRQRLLGMLRERRQDWAEIYLKRLLVEEDPRLLSGLASALNEEHSEELEAALDRVARMPGRNPSTFVWLAEQAAGDEELARRQPALLLQQILKAVSGPAFAPYRARVTAMTESGGTVPKLLDHLDAEGAAKAKRAFDESQLPGSDRQSLLTALELRFPDLRAPVEAALYATPHSIQERKLGLKELLEEEIPANRRAIQEARELGDLRENFEYKSARQRHEYLSARSASLASELERVQPIDVDRLDLDQVRIGSRVVLKGADGKKSFTILGPWESDPDQGVISYESELASDLLGKKIGDDVTVIGGDWTVQAIEPAKFKA